VTVSREDVLAVVRQIEPNYRDAASQLGPEALPILEELALDDDEHVAAAAVHLGVLTDPVRAGGLVLRALDNESEVVRVIAAGALAALDDPAVPEAVVNALRDADRGVRRAGLRSSVTQPGSSDVGAEVERLSETDPDEGVRRLAVRILPRFRGESPTRAEVEMALESAPPDADTATALGPDAMPHLLEVARSGGPREVGAAVRLGTLIPGESGAQVLVAAADNGDPEVRRAVIPAMRRMAKTEIGPVIVKLLSDSDENVRRQAVRAASDALVDSQVRNSIEAARTEHPTSRDLLDQILRQADEVSRN
jgi:HEAT repeat protein